MLQALPLDVKILKTKARIREFVSHFGVDGVYISFSGGKDSTVLLDLVRQEYPQIRACYIDTGLEYPEIKAFVKGFDNVDIIRPNKPFRQVIADYGYPVISKEQSQFIYQYRTAKSEKTKATRLNGNRWGRGKISEKWKYLIDAPFKISDKCCDVMKKEPAKRYEKENGLVPIIGIMAEESQLRLTHYLDTGCNSFDGKRPKSKPLGFWREQDVLEYIYKYKLPIASVYGDVVEFNGFYKTTMCERTGCVFCAFGCHLEKGENRYQRLQKTHPQLHSYCMDKLGFREVLEYIGVEHSLPQDTKTGYACEKIDGEHQLTLKI